MFSNSSHGTKLHSQPGKQSGELGTQKGLKIDTQVGLQIGTQVGVQIDTSGIANRHTSGIANRQTCGIASRHKWDFINVLQARQLRVRPIEWLILHLESCVIRQAQRVLFFMETIRYVFNLCHKA